MGTFDNKNCNGCFYWKTLHCESYRCCHYIFIEGKKRPCPPGEGCTVKIPIKVNRRKKRVVQG